MKDKIDTNIKKACYIDEDSKNFFIIEKKFQQGSDSVCEKIQTPDFNIIYIYCLSDWFKKNCEAEIEYLEFKNIPYFWGSSQTYKDDIINFITSYIQSPQL